jgi:hypothetical protein
LLGNCATRLPTGRTAEDVNCWLVHAAPGLRKVAGGVFFHRVICRQRVAFAKPLFSKTTYLRGQANQLLEQVEMKPGYAVPGEVTDFAQRVLPHQMAMRW